jgi:hypothetical protein
MAELTEEQKEKRRESLARARAKARENRELRAQQKNEQARIERALRARTDPVMQSILNPAPEVSLPHAVPDGFDAFLLTLDDETRRILPIPKLMAIYEAGQAKAEEERLKAIEKRAMERALGTARQQKGLVPAQKAEELERVRRLAELVTWTPDLPEISDTGLRIDGRVYFHGQEVTTTRAVYETCRDIIWRNRQAELDFEGKSRLSHLRRQIAGLDRSLDGRIV